MLVERLIQFGFFAGQALVIVIALIVVASFLFNMAQKNQNKPELEIEDLGEKLDQIKKLVASSSLSKKELKSEKKREKKEKKQNEAQKSDKPTLYVLEFEGDIKASAVKGLSQEITAVLAAASDKDEVAIRLESPGGVVHGYGLAAAQLQRFKKHGLRLTVCVDKVAASGGYMMACVADEILAAPFAILGSVGVLAQVPNFHRLLKKHDIDYKEITAGDYKRTISLLGEITEKGEEKFTEQIVETHGLFKKFVSENRAQVDVAQIGTGEYWFGRQAIDLQLADQLMTSDEFLLSKQDSHQILKVSYSEKKTLGQKLGLAASKIFADSLHLAWEKFETRKWL